jgi:hypothetical protein
LNNKLARANEEVIQRPGSTIPKRTSIKGHTFLSVFALVLLSVSCPNPSPNSNFYPQADSEVALQVTASRLTGTAPLYVFFDATASSGLSEGNDLVNADFTWQFDVQNTDPNGNWEEVKGMVAGHVFETPGTYEVRTQLINPDGLIDSTTLYIEVEEFDGVTYYVSEDGDDDNDGLSPADPWETAQFAFQQLDSNERLLFRRGDTFSGLTQNLNNHSGGPIIIGAYGTGDKPIITSPDEVVINIQNSENIRLQDLHIIPENLGPSTGMVVENSENILALRLEIEQMATRAYYQDESNLLGIFDSYLHDLGVMSIFSGDSSRFSFVGNVTDNLLGAPQPEHAIRIQGGEKQFLAFNNFYHLDDTKTAITIRGDGQRHVMIYKNIMDRILGVNPQNAQTVAAISQVVIEGNYIGHNPDYVGNNFEPTINGINIEATRVAIRNNVIDGYYNAIFIGHDYNGVESGKVDVYHNTIHWRPVTAFSGTSGRIVRVRDVNDVNIKNNFISAADENTISIVNTDGGSSHIVSQNNLLTQTPNYIATLSSSPAHLVNLDHYDLSSSSPAIGYSEEAVPVFFDLHENPRDQENGMDVGAFTY